MSFSLKLYIPFHTNGKSKSSTMFIYYIVSLAVLSHFIYVKLWVFFCILNLERILIKKGRVSLGHRAGVIPFFLYYIFVLLLKRVSIIGVSERWDVIFGCLIPFSLYIYSFYYLKGFRLLGFQSCGT